MEDCLTMSLNLSLVLAGPILRRVEPLQVCIWIATSEPVEVEARIFEMDLGSEPKVIEPAVGMGKATSRKVGTNFFITIVVATPVLRNGQQGGQSFKVESILGYNLILRKIQPDGTVSDTALDLDKIGLLNLLTYTINHAGRDVHVPLPTFYIQGPESSLRFLHGSCRALHGAGSDSSSLADTQIEKNLLDLEKRPSVIFLTGDQIYADDVAAALISHLSRLGRKVLGWDQTIPGIGDPSRLRMLERSELIEKHVGFSSSEKDNHLLGLGEYIAMYLVAWNQSNWPCEYPEGPVDKELRKDYQEQIEKLDVARAVVWKFRRALANISTYMIFDDHDVTDDWNLDAKWYYFVLRKAGGRRVVANALIAFCLFQAWGNEPNRYDDIVNKVLKELQRVSNQKRGGTEDTSYSVQLEDDILKFNEWRFIAPTNPPVLVLDTRTRRHYKTASGPAELIKPEDYRAMKETLRKYRRADGSRYLLGQPLIVISAAPVFGPLFIEERGQPLYASIDDNYAADLESWIASDYGLIHLMKFLMEDLKIQRCIFLSGDVHFCSTISATFTTVPKSQGQAIRTMHIVQLTSSAFKNITPINNAIDALYKRRLRKIINWYSAHSPSLLPKTTYRLSDLIHTKKDGFATLHFDEMSQPFVETRTYEYPENSPNMFLFNATNIGYVRISPDARAIEHELSFIDDPRSLSYLRMTRLSDSNFYKRVVSLRLPLMQYSDLITIIETLTATRVLE